MATLIAKVTLAVVALVALPVAAEPARIENGVRVHYGMPQEASQAGSRPAGGTARVFIDPGYRGTELYEPLLSDYPLHRDRLRVIDGRFVYGYGAYSRRRPSICIACYSTIIVHPERVE